MPRKITGLFSLDYALGDPQAGRYGFPLRAIYELYGRPERGKNSLAFFLAGSIRPDGIIAYNWLETADPDYVRSAVGQGGFQGEIRMIDHYAEGDNPEVDPPKTHETLLKEGAVLLNQPKVNAYILDSLGMTRSQAEKEGEYGNSYWGMRAKLVNQHMRDLEGIVMDKPGPACAAFALNHVQTSMERSPSGAVIYTTPGGEGKEYASVGRVHLKTANPKEIIPMDTITISRGVVDKLRFGGKGREFIFCIVPSIGVSRGLTAVQDCYTLKLINRETGGELTTKSRSKKNPKVALGKVSELIKSAYARDEEPFMPFYDLLEPMYGPPAAS